MSRIGHKRRKHAQRRTKRPPPGAKPGTIAIDPAATPSLIRVMACSPTACSDLVIQNPAELSLDAVKGGTRWINVDGVGSSASISTIGSMIGLHMLTVADICNVYQRPKVEEYDDYIYLVIREPHADGALTTEQISICLKADLVATFQERPGDCFDPIRARIHETNSRICARGPDYLAYALIDAIIDSYFPILEGLGDRLELLEERVFSAADEQVLTELHCIRRDLVTLRRSVWPLRDPLNLLLRSETKLVSAETRIYLRDCYDHVVQIIDLIETHREICSSLMEVYLSQLSQRTNEVMKVLAMIGTVFLPLTFIVGVYGMNFDTSVSPWNMPELKWRWGYPAIWAVMIAVGGGTLWLFHRFGWIGRRRRHAANGANGASNHAASGANRANGNGHGHS
ncbi:MAG: magnesium/cobalt transporter CorA [Phycisphaerales bacterium]|nr:magnesium/cobalt transporter CorA [Phycisphaerales bacterium]